MQTFNIPKVFLRINLRCFEGLVFKKFAFGGIKWWHLILIFQKCV